MSRAFEKIKAGLEDALAFARGDRSRGKLYRVPIRELSPEERKRIVQGQQFRVDLKTAERRGIKSK